MDSLFDLESIRKIWRRIWRNFEQRYPNLSKRAIHYHPCDWGRIVIYLKDGEIIIYDDDMGTCFITDERWKD